MEPPTLLYNMRRVVGAILLAALLFFSIAAYPASASFKCGTTEEVIKAAFDNGYAFLATAAGEHGEAIVVFLNVRRGAFGKWLIVGVDENGGACVLLKGDSWQFAIERKA